MSREPVAVQSVRYPHPLAHRHPHEYQRLHAQSQSQSQPRSTSHSHSHSYSHQPRHYPTSTDHQSSTAPNVLDEHKREKQAWEARWRAYEEKKRKWMDAWTEYETKKAQAAGVQTIDYERMKESVQRRWQEYEAKNKAANLAAESEMPSLPNISGRSSRRSDDPKPAAAAPAAASQPAYSHPQQPSTFAPPPPRVVSHSRQPPLRTSTVPDLSTQQPQAHSTHPPHPIPRHIQRSQTMPHAHAYSRSEPIIVPPQNVPPPTTAPLARPTFSSTTRRQDRERDHEREQRRAAERERDAERERERLRALEEHRQAAMATEKKRREEKEKRLAEERRKVEEYERQKEEERRRRKEEERRRREDQERYAREQNEKSKRQLRAILGGDEADEVPQPRLQFENNNTSPRHGEDVRSKEDSRPKSTPPKAPSPQTPINKHAPPHTSANTPADPDKDRARRHAEYQAREAAARLAGHTRRESSRAAREQLRRQWEADKLAEEQKAYDMEQEKRRKAKEGWEIYERRWSDLLELDRRRLVEDGSLGWTDFAWPVYGAERLRSPRDIHAESVGRFLLNRRHSEDRTPRQRIKDAMLRFHPDRFEGRWMSHVRPSERAAVKDAVLRVTRALNDALAELPRE